jgi:hypothetical protein
LLTKQHCIRNGKSLNLQVEFSCPNIRLLKMKKQNIILLLVLLLISVSAYFAFFKNNSELTEFDLRIQDTSQVTSFTVESKSIKVILEKKSENWMVNKAYHANNQLIKRVFRIFKHLNISIIARKDSNITYVQQLKNNGTKVQFYKDDRKITSFWIGDFNPSKNATLLMNEREQPVFVTAPGLSSNIAKFVIADDIFWRDKRIFDFEPGKIKKIQLKDYQKPSASFILSIDGSNYQLINNKNSEIEFDQEKIARYLSYFRGVRFESLEEKFSSAQLDSVIEQKPLYEITIQSKDYDDLKLKLLPKSVANKKNKTDLNFVYGIINNQKTLVIISFFSIDPLLKEIDYFKPK